MATNVKKMKPEELPVQEETTTLSERQTKIAEVAYSKAEKRGFEPGHDMEDWLEAEKELTP